MNRYREFNVLAGSPVDVMATVNPKQIPAVLFEDASQLFSGNIFHELAVRANLDFELHFLGYTTISRTLSLLVAGGDGTSTDKHPSTASRRFLTNSSIVSPCVAQ